MSDTDQHQGFIIREVNDETWEVHLNGEHITTLTHDEDGWAGIDRVELVLENVARILGLTFTRE